jgi:hypothetical protein
MDEIPSTSSQGSPNELSSKPPLESTLRAIFTGPNGIRAGWRLLIFVTTLSLLGAGAFAVGRAMAHGRTMGSGLSPAGMGVSEAVIFAFVLLTSWIMARFEGRKIADYGLPWRGAFRLQFLQGIVIGFASITALLVAMRVAGVFHFGSLALHGVEIWEYALIWGFVFLFVGFFEEFFFRGYFLFTLTTGIGFWPAATVMSIFFGYIHHTNPGESWLGSFSAGAVGLLLCLMLRRTGDLWMPIGFHAAWDWGETYFYGVPDSGQVARGHLLNSSSSGPTWLTGGAVGPEGSWLCLLLLVLLWAIFAVLLREEKYPNAAAIPDPRRAPFDLSPSPNTILQS